MTFPKVCLKIKYLIFYALLQVGYEQHCCIRRGESLVVKHQGQDEQGGLGRDVELGGHDVDVGDVGHGGYSKQGGDGGHSLRISLLTPPQVLKAI